LGFRCARLAGGGTTVAGHYQGAFRIPIETRTPHYTPVAAAAFPALLDHYRYDARPLEASVLETSATPDWTRHKIRYVALEGDTALAYLYLPRQAAVPFQTMVYVASTAAFVQVRTVPEEVEWAVGPNIRAGRAALAIVFKGMAERAFGPAWDPPAPNSVRFRDLMVLHATELRRGLDYLATRQDIDMGRLAYVAVSWGAGSRLTLAAVDQRFHAVVLVGGGIDERVQPTLPEASNINFAPYIRPPKLLLNGRDDEEHPWLTRALPLWNLLREPKQLVLVPGAGHVPPLAARVPAINRFLDQTLGAVRRGLTP
jgi:pimeloyl-ACP methyl ester carboxylesterase